MIDGIEFFQLLWFLLIGLLFIIFYFTEGFDYGVGMAAKFLARDDAEKHLLMNTIGPHWDGNEVWLITAGGAMFASFAAWYASLFSGYYILLFLTLFALIIRGVSFEFSAHAETERGFHIWTNALFIGSLCAPFLLTMMFGSLIQGVPMDAQGNMSLGVWNIINPLSVVAGIAGVLLCFMHGLNFIVLKTDGDIRERARKLNSKLYWLAYAGEVVFALLVIFQTDFFKRRPISSLVITLIIVLLTICSHVACVKGKEGLSFTTSGLTLGTVVALLFNGLFPRVLIATNPAHSILIKDAANSHYTLVVMTIVAVILLPIALIYIIWSYFLFKKRIKA